MTTFTFQNEDHTLGNLLRAQLLTDPKVDFAAYKLVHPLKREIEIFIDSEDPEASLKESAKKLLEIVKELQASLKT